MRTWMLFALLMILSLLQPSSAVAQPAATKPNLGANAAMKYWQAFAQMPVLDKDQEKLLADWDRVPLDEAALKLINASAKSRQYLLRGSKLKDCDWSLDYEDGMGLLLPYLAKSRDLARLAALHARYEFSQGHAEAGLEDAAAILALGRQAGNEPIMICILVRYAIETIAIDLLAQHLSGLKPHSAEVVAILDRLPAGATLPQAFQAEKRNFIEWLIQKLKQGEQKKPGAWRELLQGACDPDKGENVVKQVGSYERAIELTTGMLPICDRLAVLVALPKDQFEAQYPEFKKNAKASNLLAGEFLTAADKMLATQHRNEALYAMLKAALAVVNGGPGKLKEIKDPFGSGPFAYQALDKGFELRSNLHYQDKPVTLTVGQPRKR